MRTWILLFVLGMVFAHTPDLAGAEGNALRFPAHPLVIEAPLSARDTTFRVPFTNISGRTVIISAAKSSCSCATVALPRHRLLPGETGDAVVGYTVNHDGERVVEMAFSLVDDLDGTTATEACRVTVRVPKLFSADLQSLRWSESELGATKMVQIVPGSAVTIGAVEVLGRHFSLASAPAAGENGETRIAVSLSDQGAEAGTGCISITCDVGGGLMRTGTIFLFPPKVQP